MNIKNILLELQRNPYLYQGQIKEKNITKKDIYEFADYFNLSLFPIKDKNNNLYMRFLKNGRLMELNDFINLKYKGKEISYNGISMISVFADNIDDSKFNELKKEYYKKPSLEKVYKEIISLYNGGVKNSNITNYFVKDLMAKTKIWYNKWSIEDVFNSHDLLSHFYYKSKINKKIFPDTNSEIKNIETAFRLGGKGVASKPANFPIKTVDKVLNKYNINNIYYDPSCGWGQGYAHH